MLLQIGEIIRFDGRRNLKKTLAMITINAVFFCFAALFSIPALLPTEAANYAMIYLGNVNQFLIPLTAVIFGAPIVVEDFEKKTGNLLFPKVSRGRLLFGRYVSRLSLGSLAISVYYMSVAIATMVEYGTVPGALWGSFGWANVFLHLLLSFMTVLSASLNRVATTIVAGVLLPFYAFNALLYSPLSQIATQEPFFLPSYFGRILYWWLDMPDSRFYVYPFSGGGIVSGEWRTPSVEGTIFYVALYTALFLALAVLIYRRKELKT